MSERKYGSSAVTLSLPTRILLTVPVVVVPVLLVVAMFTTLASGEGDVGLLLRTVSLGFAGAMMLVAAPRVLRSIWAPNPRWRNQDQEAAALERALADSLAKDRPPGPGPSGPTSISRRPAQ